MSGDIEAASPTGILHRVGRRPMGVAGLVARRPRRHIRQPLRRSSRRVSGPVRELGSPWCLPRVLARYRADPAAQHELGEIEVEPHQADLDGPEPGRLPRSWLDHRAMGSARAAAQFAAVSRARSLAYLRDHLADRTLHYKIPELDGSAIRLSVPRAFTQEVSRLVFECATDTSDSQFAGINYRSRLGDEVENWAIFEPATRDDPLNGQSREPIDPDDPDLHAALELHGIELV